MGNDDPQKPSGNQYFDKINASLVAWLVFLSFGGGILALYYARIHYLPDIEWSSSIVFLALATFVGGAFTLALGLSLFIPGYIWSEFLMFDKRLQDVFFYHPDTDEVCLRNLMWYIGLPFAIVLVLNHLSLLIFPCLLSCCSSKGSKLIVAYGIVSAVLLVLVSIVMRRVFRDLQSFGGIEPKLMKRAFRKTDSEVTSPPVMSPPEFGDEEKRRRIKYIFWFLLSIIVSQISMVLIHLMSNRPTGMPFLITTGFCAFGVLVSNHVVAVHYRRSRLHAILTAIVVAALLLFIADRNESLSLRVVAFFGGGENSQNVDLVLNDEGSKMIGCLDLSNDCCFNAADLRHCNDATDVSKLPHKVCRVRVLSRLGNEFYLEDSNHRKFTLQKSFVVARITSQQQEIPDTTECYCIFDKEPEAPH